MTAFKGYRDEFVGAFPLMREFFQGHVDSASPRST